MNGQDPRYADTLYTVEATDYEALCLWEKYRDKVVWKEDASGLGVTIGNVDERPVHVSVTWAVLDDRRVAFIEPTSVMVDWRMVEKWRKHVFVNSKGHTNPMNFGMCLTEVRKS